MDDILVLVVTLNKNGEEINVNLTLKERDIGHMLDTLAKSYTIVIHRIYSEA